MKNITILIVIVLVVVMLSAIFIFTRNSDDLCKQMVGGNGMCEAYFEGYEFDNSVGICVKKGVSGCSFESPFETLEECQIACER